jgi:hypothetical protein
MKIAFCFLVYDQIYNLDLWNHFFSEIPSSQYSIYIHSKNKFKHQPLFEKNNIYTNALTTKWGDISLINATLFLFDKALKDNCDYFISLSADMIPLWDFNYIKKYFDSSLFSIQPKNLTTDFQKKFNYIRHNLLDENFKNKVPFNIFEKQNMFFSITKNDLLVIQKNNLTDQFSRFTVPDEYYFVNLFTFLNLKYKKINYIYVNTNPAYTSAIDFKYKDLNIKEIKKNNYLFLRKIKDVQGENLTNFLSNEI